METLFTPYASFGGGLLIGLGAVLLMLGLGRILGATGIMSGLVFAENSSEFSWRAAMVVGMILSPMLIFAFTGSMPELSVPVSPLMIVIGGVIVGLGASLGPAAHLVTVSAACHVYLRVQSWRCRPLWQPQPSQYI